MMQKEAYLNNDNVVSHLNFISQKIKLDEYLSLQSLFQNLAQYQPALLNELNNHFEDISSPLFGFVWDTFDRHIQFNFLVTFAEGGFLKNFWSTPILNLYPNPNNISDTISPVDFLVRYDFPKLAKVKNGMLDIQGKETPHSEVVLRIVKAFHKTDLKEFNQKKFMLMANFVQYPEINQFFEKTLVEDIYVDKNLISNPIKKEIL